MINYDIHWNPVRLMQRIGRVDRRMDPDIEKRLIADHPEVASSRGKVRFWNFLPPEELNAILTLYSKVTQKTLLISKTPRHRRQEAADARRRLRCVEGVQSFLRGTKT